MRKAKALSKKGRKGLHEKICNMCGESCFIYMIYKNAPLCSDCMPVKELKKISKVPNDAKMLNSLLRFSKNGNN